MAPSTTSHGHQSSPPSDSIQPPLTSKRSLRSRGSNAGMATIDGGKEDGGDVKSSVVVGGDDACGGKSPLCHAVDPCVCSWACSL